MNLIFPTINIRANSQLGEVKTKQPKKNQNCFYSKSIFVFYTKTRDRFVVSKHEYAIWQCLAS